MSWLESLVRCPIRGWRWIRRWFQRIRRFARVRKNRNDRRGFLRSRKARDSKAFLVELESKGDSFNNISEIWSDPPVLWWSTLEIKTDNMGVVMCVTQSRYSVLSGRLILHLSRELNSNRFYYMTKWLLFSPISRFKILSDHDSLHTPFLLFFVIHSQTLISHCCFYCIYISFDYHIH